MERFSRRGLFKKAGALVIAAETIAQTGCIPSTENQPPRFRTKTEALISYRLRSFWHGRRSPDSPLEKILNTNLSDSKQIGLVNSHLLEEQEGVDLGNFSFAIKPWDPVIETELQLIPLLANTRSFTSFRRDSNSIVRAFDRTVWAVNNGHWVTAVIETDEANKENIEFTANMLLDLGIRSFRIGNETNNPKTPWLANPRQIFEFATQVRKLAEVKKIDAEVSFPPLAYYGNGEHLRELVKYCQQASGDKLPFSRYSFNFYGPIYDLISRIQMMRFIARQEGIDHLNLDISETGNPGPEIAREEIPDIELAHHYIPQSLALIIGSKLINLVDYYSLYNGESPSHSLTRLQGNTLVAKPSFQAYSVMTKLLAKLQNIELDDNRSYTKVEGQRTDGIHFSVIWAKDQDLNQPLNRSDLVFDALGKPTSHSGTIVLKKRPREYLGGQAKIIIHEAA